jgi:predicted enzyme related to lactoylglutathione lyase
MMSTAIKAPTYRTGKICYIEIPAKDIEESAAFYHRAFGWQTRRRGDGSTAFDDTVNEVSGTWVLGRPVAVEPGLMIYIMVASAAKAVKPSGLRAAKSSIKSIRRPGKLSLPFATPREI